jgi:hypothetical protein
VRKTVPPIAVMLLVSVLGGCNPFQRKPPKPPAPPAPKPLAAAPKRQISPPPILNPPPEIAPQAVGPETPPPPIQEEAQFQPPPRPRRRAPQAAPAAAPKDEGEPVPQLVEILTEEKRKQYEQEYSENLGRARNALAQAGGRNLTGEQMETAGRIRTFLQQAEEVHARDLTTALQLARRAGLLADDLIQALR